MTLGMPSATCTKLSTVIKLNKEPETTIPTEPQADINTMLCAVFLVRIKSEDQYLVLTFLIETVKGPMVQLRANQ